MQLLVRFSPNLACSFVSAPPRHRKCQNRHFSKSKMAADEKRKFTENWISSKRFVQYAPNLACSIYSGPGTSVSSQNREIHNSRWPPAANFEIYKNLNNSRTVRPILTKFGTQLRLVAAQTLEQSKNAIFQNPRWPPTKNWNLLKIE